MKTILLYPFMCLTDLAMAPVEKEGFYSSNVFYSTGNVQYPVITIVNLMKDGLKASFHFKGKITKAHAVVKIDL